MIRTALVVMGALILTTVSVHSFDAAASRGEQGVSIMRAVFDAAERRVTSLKASVAARFVRETSSSVCPEGMVRIDTTTCIDMFEASTGSSCPISSPSNVVESGMNVDMRTCKAVSVKGVLPWRNVTLWQAQQACQQAGKELVDNAVWYAAASRMDASPHTCVLEENAVQKTGSTPTCVTDDGVYDMVGNVWEWVDLLVHDGWVGERKLPLSGYVVSVDEKGLPLKTVTTRTEAPDAPRFWLDERGIRGVMRGGYHRSGTDGGVHALYAASAPDFSGSAVGFRCMIRW